MSEPTPNRWRGMSRDARAAERRAQILDVGFDLLGTEGLSGTTVRKVCETAKLNPRYFYESFADLDALVVAVFDKVMADSAVATATAVAAVAGQGDPSLVVRSAVGGFLRFVSEDTRRARVLFMEGLSNEALSQRRFDMIHTMADALVRDAMGVTDPSQPVSDAPSLVVVAANLFMGGISELVMSWVTGRLDVTLDELEADATDLFLVISEGVRRIGVERGFEPRSPLDGAEDFAHGRPSASAHRAWNDPGPGEP